MVFTSQKENVCCWEEWNYWEIENLVARIKNQCGTCLVEFIWCKTKYTALQIIIPNADVALSTTAKMGMIGALRISPRRTTVSGPAKSMASPTLAPSVASRHLPQIPSGFGGGRAGAGLKSPNLGAIRNHETQSGMNVVNMRGKKEIPVSPWVAKPISVTMNKVNVSPRIRMVLFM